jgi:hypothetical protein
LIQPRRVGRRQRQQALQRAVRQHDPNGAPEQPQQRALCQHLTDNAAPARAEGTADRHLALPSRCLRQQQIGHVRTRDQQHRRHRGHQHQQRRTDGTHHIAQHADGDRRLIRIELRILLRQPPRDRGHLAIGALDGHAAFEPRQNAIRMIVAAGPCRSIQRQRRPHRGLRRKIEVRGHDRDHASRPVVQLQLASENAPVSAEPLLPQGIAEDHDAVVAWLRLRLRERAPQQRRYAQRRKKARVAHRSDEALRLAFAAGQVQRGGSVSAHRPERPRLGAPIEVIPRRDRELRKVALRSALPESHQFLRSGKGERIQQNPVGGAEHGAGGADAQPDGENRGNGHRWIPAQRAPGKLQILENVHARPSLILNGEGVERSRSPPYPARITRRPRDATYSS